MNSNTRSLSLFEEAAAFLVNHGAGHNSRLNHPGDNNGYDEKGKYQQGEPLFVPASPNVMTGGNQLLEGGGLQRFITSPVNQQPASNGDTRRLSIKQFYLHRFGNNDPNAKLPTDN